MARLHQHLCCLLLALGGVAFAQDSPAELPAIPWNARTVEHLFNRAGFGLRPDQLPALLAAGPERVVDSLLDGGETVEPFFLGKFRPPSKAQLAELSDKQKRELRRAKRRDDRAQIEAYRNWWFGVILEGKDPLRDRMTLFWHDFFPSAYSVVKRSDEMIRQHGFLRAGALGSYADLLHGIVRDPAMLRYLDNNTNNKGNCNENLARELLELFSLGEGNYSEKDVKEAARALTGMRGGADGEYRFLKRRHDKGMKQFLGRQGRFHGGDIVDILLEQEACARWVSHKLLSWFEGVEPGAGRLDAYAAFLREQDYELKPFLRRLFLDPDFYRAEVLGTRVQSPVDYLVGACIRLDLEAPERYLARAAGTLGQEIFDPPSVKGWEEGEGWITTGSLMQRGNVAALLLGVLDFDEAFVADPLDSELVTRTSRFLQSQREGGKGERRVKGEDIPRLLRGLKKAFGERYRPELNLTWRMERIDAQGPADVVDALLEQLLAVEPPAETRAVLTEYLEAEIAALGATFDDLFEYHLEGELLLRRLAHLILSLPVAQLD